MRSTPSGWSIPRRACSPRHRTCSPYLRPGCRLPLDVVLQRRLGERRVSAALISYSTWFPSHTPLQVALAAGDVSVYAVVPGVDQHPPTRSTDRGLEHQRHFTGCRVTALAATTKGDRVIATLIAFLHFARVRVSVLAGTQSRNPCQGTHLVAASPRKRFPRACTEPRLLS
jgi:hypothetical protein